MYVAHNLLFMLDLIVDMVQQIGKALEVEKSSSFFSLFKKKADSLKIFYITAHYVRKIDFIRIKQNTSNMFNFDPFSNYMDYGRNFELRNKSLEGL